MKTLTKSRKVIVHDINGLIPYRRVAFPKTDYSSYIRNAYDDGSVEFIPVKE